MKYVEPLLDSATITLQEMYKNAPIHRLRQRAHIILMSNKGFKLEEISKATDLDRNTISRTINAWEEIGLMGLYDETRSGRPCLFNQEEKEWIAAQINQEPRQLKKVKLAIEENSGKGTSVDTLKRIAKEAGLVWKRMKKTAAGTTEPKLYHEKKSLRNLKDTCSNQRD